MTTKPDVPMNDEQIWCSHIITRYELGNTYCAKCHLWLYAGYEKAEAKPEPSTGAREMDPREFVLRNYGHQHESEYYSSEIYNAMKLFAEYIHQSRMKLVAQEAAREAAKDVTTKLLVMLQDEHKTGFNTHKSFRQAFVPIIQSAIEKAGKE